MLVVVALAFLAVGSAALWQIRALSAGESTGGPAAAGDPPTTASEAVPAPTTAAGILREWDRRRAQAYADGDIGALEALYVDGSRSGRQDVRLLDRYLERGLTIQGMTTQVLKLRVLSGGTDGDLLVLRVSDRTTSAVATGKDNRVRLPTAAAQVRVLRLARHEGRWLVSSVRDTVSE